MYSLWAMFHDRPARIFNNLTSDEAANWIVRFRKANSSRSYWLQLA